VSHDGGETSANERIKAASDYLRRLGTDIGTLTIAQMTAEAQYAGRFAFDSLLIH